MTIMPNEIQFILYNLPEEEGKVQVVIKGGQGAGCHQG